MKIIQKLSKYFEYQNWHLCLFRCIFIKWKYETSKKNFLSCFLSAAYGMFNICACMKSVNISYMLTNILWKIFFFCTVKALGFCLILFLLPKVHTLIDRPTSLWRNNYYVIISFLVMDNQTTSSVVACWHLPFLLKWPRGRSRLESLLLFFRDRSFNLSTRSFVTSGSHVLLSVFQNRRRRVTSTLRNSWI